MDKKSSISRSQLSKPVMFVDLAASTKESADFTAIAVVATDDDANVYILDVIRGRWEWPIARRIIAQAAISHQPRVVGVEKVGFQLAAIQDLMRQPDLMGVAIKGIPVDRDKLSRALPWLARAEQGKMKLIRGSWNAAFLDEVCAFPETEHDDQVDAVSGAVQMLGQAPAFYY